MAPAIRGERLHRTFGGVPAVIDLSFEVPAGSFVTLLGPSGCGKSTTLRCLAGLERPDSGAIWFGERQVVGPETFVPAKSRGAGMVFQSYAIWPHMRVFENIAYPLKGRRVPPVEIDKRVKAVAEMVGIEQLLERYPSQLSGGQQQRVALARSIVYEPAVLFLDEPLSNLDAKLRTQMRFELAAIQRRLGTTTVYVTHDQKEALVMSDRILLMRDGRAIQYGTPEELYAKPADRYAAEFLGQANFIEGIAKRLTEGGPTTVIAYSGIALATTDRRDDLVGHDVVAMVRPHNIHINPKSGTGDNVFEATVKQSAFLGERREAWLTVAGALLHAFSDDPVKADDRVTVAIRPEDIVIVEAKTT